MLDFLENGNSIESEVFSDLKFQVFSVKECNSN